MWEVKIYHGVEIYFYLQGLSKIFHGD